MIPAINLDTLRAGEKETLNINVVGKNSSPNSSHNGIGAVAETGAFTDVVTDVFTDAFLNNVCFE